MNGSQKEIIEIDKDSIIFNKIYRSVVKFGWTKAIKFNLKHVNWVVSQIGWLSMCKMAKTDYESYLFVFKKYLCVAETENLKSNFAYIPNLDFFETETILL